MTNTRVQVNVRQVAPGVAVLDINGEINAAAEKPLAEACATAGTGTRALILNFTNLQYMNSTGIGLIVTLLVRANKQGQKVLAFGLSDHYQRIFKLTRLDEVIHLFNDETGAVASATEP